jgi:hypothetical protein
MLSDPYVDRFDKTGRKGLKSISDCQQLLFPLHTFDHAAGFAAATKFLAYNYVGHIVESRPQGVKYQHLHLDQNILRRFNDTCMDSNNGANETIREGKRSKGPLEDNLASLSV